jgi:hypothetical protein
MAETVAMMNRTPMVMAADLVVDTDVASLFAGVRMAVVMSVSFQQVLGADRGLVVGTSAWSGST